MNHKERIAAKAHARLARMKPNSGHARNLRARLGITDAPAPVVEDVKPQASKKKKASKKKSEE